MADSVQMVFIKPEFTGMNEVKRQENNSNRLATAGSLAGVAGAAAGATHLVKSGKAGQIADQVTTNQVVKNVATQAGKVKKAVTETVAKLPGKNLLAPLGEMAEKAKGQVSKLAANATEYVSKMPKPVKVAAAVTTGIVALAHAHDAGKIKGKFEGYNGANELLDKTANTVSKVAEKIVDAIGLNKKEEK